MLASTKQLKSLASGLPPTAHQLRFLRSQPGPNRRRSSAFPPTKKAEEKSEWWIVDGEMHEVGDHVPPRERFVIPRDNIPNRRRKQLREQFMRRTRLVLKESEHEPWCKGYMELYQELRENWERLYWDEGYSKKIAQDHANYESSEDDDRDFNPYRGRRVDQMKDYSFVRNRQDDAWERANLIRDKFEYDRERRMREKAFAPMNGGRCNGGPSLETPDSSFQNKQLDARRYFSDESD